MPKISKVQFNGTVEVPYTSGYVKILDEKLKADLCNILNNPTSACNLTYESLASIEKLDLDGENITDLEGLELCTNLTTLVLSNNNITDILYIDLLSKLSKLTDINLDNNHIVEIGRAHV